MGKEYIEREAVFDVLFGQYCASCDETEQALNAAIEEIKTIPAADVVPVVRCGECKYWDKYENTAGYGYCLNPDSKFNYGANGYVFRPNREQDFFCASGERMDGDGE